MDETTKTDSPATGGAADTPAATAPDWRKTLREHRETALAGGGEDKIEARRAKGLMSARDRLDALFQERTFQEIGAHAQQRGRHFGMDGKVLPCDGVIAGTGFVNNLPVAAFSQDFTVQGGTLGKAHAEKIVDVMTYAGKNGVPVVAFKDSAGARIQEGVDALSGYGRVFYENVRLSGVVPQIAVIAGPCAGGASYSPALMDFIIMVDKNAHMFITGPEVIKSVTGRDVTMDDVGSASVHAAVNGNVHFVAEDDEHAVEIVRRLLEYLPANNAEDPPHQPHADIELDAEEDLDDLVPADPSEPMDTLVIIERLVDPDSFLQVHERWARNLIVGFARIGGIVVGIVANQSMHMAGTLDIDASDKGARFVRFCNAFNIPIVTLVDVPGFLPGIEQERGGIIRHGAKMLFAYSASTVPKLTVIMRKAYGGSYLAMCSREMGADAVFAWPMAEIAVMGAEGAVRILNRKELKDAEDPKAKAKELAREYRERFASPYLSAGLGYVTDIIAPSETRGQLALELRKTLGKRDVRPPKKHGLIPL
ncbi:MAG: acyl-CoA carboxylase subunit beta [Hyphomicrobiales bacterium]|nr:acyl-CoA carboxylase subunit beta [Hyphomicrobiales bacterium]